MPKNEIYLQPSEAAARLGVSIKALRIYEERGLITPPRSDAGWRAYGPREMARASEIAALRSLGLSLTQIERVLNADVQELERALASHQTKLESEALRIHEAIGKVRRLRDGVAKGDVPEASQVSELLAPHGAPVVSFDLPWPWGGERFELREILPLTYLVGPLFSGKTKLAQCLADTLPNAAFVGLDRLEDDGQRIQTSLAKDPALDARVTQALTWLLEDGADESDELLALLIALEMDGPGYLVIDLIEQGLDAATQRALIAYLRRREEGARPLFLMTRSCEILDLGSVGAREAIILCPANHAPPSLVAPYPGAPGYEAVTTCLASPEVRARTQGVVAYRPPAA